MRWEDCVKIDVRKAGEQEDWKKKTRDRGGWKRLSDDAVKKLRAAPHPWQRETRKREMYVCNTLDRLSVPGRIGYLVEISSYHS